MQHWVVGYFANKLTVPEEYCENFIMSGLFYYVLRMYSKMILAFSDVSVCMSNFCKTLENARVDGEYFERQMSNQAANQDGCLLENDKQVKVDVQNQEGAPLM